MSKISKPHLHFIWRNGTFLASINDPSLPNQQNTSAFGRARRKTSKRTLRIVTGGALAGSISRQRHSRAGEGDTDAEREDAHLLLGDQYCRERLQAYSISQRLNEAIPYVHVQWKRETAKTWDRMRYCYLFRLFLNISEPKWMHQKSNSVRIIAKLETSQYLSNGRHQTLANNGQFLAEQKLLNLYRMEKNLRHKSPVEN